MNITFKLARRVPESRNNENAIQTRFEYAELFYERYAFVLRTGLTIRLPIGTENIIYVDEAGFNLHLRRSFGRSARGDRVNVVVPNSRGRNISVSAAMHLNGLLHFKTIQGASNTAVFLNFMAEVMNRCGTGTKYFVMDNVRFHHSIEVKDLIESRGHQIVFIPPYSPQLNPIELLFSKWKQIIKTSPRANNAGELLAFIEIASQQITATDCQGWSRESQRFLMKALQRQEFLN